MGMAWQAFGLFVLLVLVAKAAAQDDVVEVAHKYSPHGGAKRSVCIIGAGAGGLASALRLRQKGYRDITVFERNAVPGGKAVTVKVENNEGVSDAPLYIAAILGVWGSYSAITSLLQDYNVPISNLSYNGQNPGAQINYNTYVVNHETGTIIPSLALPTNRTALAEAAAKYTVLYMQAKPYIGPGFLKGVPAELRQSYGSWLRTNGLELLLPALYTIVTAYGYGSLEVTPACYALNFVDPYLLQAVAGSGGTFITDFEMLWKRVAADLASSGVKFVYSADISRVRQSSLGKSTIKYTVPGRHPTTARCDRIIAAFPHIKKNLAAFDLDAQERAVFDKVRQVQYYSAVINLPNSSKGRFSRLLKLTGNAAAPFTLAEPPGDGLPAVYATWPWTPVAQYWAWVEGETEIPMETLATNAIAIMSKYNRPVGAPVNESVPLTKTDLRRLDKWDYFAQFNVYTLTETSFAELEALQGRRSTFYTSSLRCFESQEMVVQSANDIVDRYF